MKVEGKKKSNVRGGDWSRERPGVGCAISPAGDMWSGQQVISITCKYAWTVVVCDTCIRRTTYHGHSRVNLVATTWNACIIDLEIQRITRKKEEDRLVTLSISCLTKPDVAGRGPVSRRLDTVYEASLHRRRANGFETLT